MQAYRAFRGYGSHGMLIDKRLFMVVFQHDSEIIKADDPALNGYTVRKVDGNAHFFLADLVENEVLQVIFSHHGIRSQIL